MFPFGDHPYISSQSPFPLENEASVLRVSFMLQRNGFKGSADQADAHGRDDCAVQITFDGEALRGTQGQTIAAVLMAAGRRTWRYTSRRGEPRGLFCGMGVCFDCLVRVDGRSNLRACQTPVAEAMRVETQQGAGSWEVSP
jgi:hypothetical protein